MFCVNFLLENWFGGIYVTKPMLVTTLPWVTGFYLFFRVKYFTLLLFKSFIFYHFSFHFFFIGDSYTIEKNKDGISVHFSIA
jgi:hypothetical protein